MDDSLWPEREDDSSASSSLREFEHGYTSIHAAHDPPPSPYSPEATRLGTRPQRRRRPSPPPVAWALLSLGIATLMCGGMLMFWSFFDGRTELWTVGTPLSLGGQALILIGLVLQMDILWQSSRESSAALQDIDGQLARLNRMSKLPWDRVAGHR